MSNYTRSPLTGDLAPVNAELEKVQQSIADKLDRNPSTGQANQLENTLDANNNRIINLPTPSSPNDAVRLKDLASSQGNSLIPPQGSQVGKFLRTDGTTAYWDSVTKTVVGLASVDNTSDADKPVSTATNTELVKKASYVNTFAALALLSPAETEIFVCIERDDTEYIVQAVGYTALAGDVTFANGKVAQLQTGPDTTVFSFGAIADYNGVTFTGTDNTTAFNDCKERCHADKIIFKMGGGSFYFNGGQLHFDRALTYEGAGIEKTVLYFSGSPTKTMETFITWKVAYNTGDYSTSADANVAYAIKVSKRGVLLQNFSVATATQYTGYTTPWNSATDAPTSNYDYGILINEPENSVLNVNVYGTWAIMGGCLNGTAGSFGDSFSCKDSFFGGRYGFGIVGAEGQPVSGEEYLDLVAGDTRTGGGMSDLHFERVGLSSTFATLKTRLTINGTKTRVRVTNNPAGALYISGQLASNAAKRIQGIRFYNCRFSGAEKYNYYANYVNRLEFFGCTSDANTDAIDTDGSSLGISDFAHRITENARNVVFVGGNSSAETDERARLTPTGERVFSEFGYKPSDTGVSTLSFDNLSDKGAFTPVLTGSSGVPTYSTQSGNWVKIGNLVKIWIRIDVATVNTLTGTITIPIPFTASSDYASTFPVKFGIVKNIQILDGFAGHVGSNTAIIALYRNVTDANINTFNQTDLIDGARIDIEVDILI
jgi:hypothetical protein